MTLGDFAQNLFPAGRRWAVRNMWRLEHAFERAKAAGRAEDDARLRIFCVLAVFSLGFGALAVGAAHSALFGAQGGAGGPAAVVGASRGDLTDRNGELLATDLTHYGLYIDPHEVWDAGETRRALLKALPGLDRARLDKALEGRRRIFVLGGLTPDARAAVHDLGLPGVTFEEESRRVYPLGETGAHIVGFSDSGGQGVAGAERALNDPLRQVAASEGSVPLSIDVRIQAALDDELRKAVAEFTPKGAVGLVTNVHTGEILGLSSWPAYDPNRAGAADDNQRLNRAAASVFEMGSTFKGFTVATGLDTGVATPNSTFDATRPFKLGYRTIHDYHAKNKVMTLTEVFQYSSNIGTAMLAESIGAARLSKYFQAFGLTSPAKVELFESARPLTPKKWDADAVASTSFGHGMNVSPLALARAYGGILNGGKLVPLTIRKVPEGTKIDGPRIVSEQTTLQMLQIMRANVIPGGGGSGGKADAPGLTVGGKTGTGEKYDPSIRAYNHQKQVSSFAAVFPTSGGVEQSRYFVLILMDEPHGSKASFGFSTGGWVAAPAAGRVIDRIAPFLHVKRQPDAYAFAEAAPSSPGEGL